jgi:hypothetical protein
MMRRGSFLSLFCVAIVLLASNAGLAAERKRKSPELSGTLLIQWSNETRFIYTPDERDPLLFQTRDGREVRPGRIYTDGGSIPRIFWSAKGLSPWGYGPAYLLHDWLFHQHRCNHDSSPNKYTISEANEVLDDAIGLLMASKKVMENQTARRLIKWAVDKYGKTAWNESCDPEPTVTPDGLRASRTNAPLITVGTVTVNR